MKTKFLLSALATLILAFGVTTANAASLKHEGSKAPAVNMHKANQPGPQKKHHRHRHHRKHHRVMKHK